MEPVEKNGVHKEKVRVNKKTLEAVLEQCQLALQQLASGCDDDDDDDGDTTDVINDDALDFPKDSTETSVSTISDIEFYGLLQSGVESADFLKKLESVQASISQNAAEEGSSWDMVSKNDLWDVENTELETEDFVLVGKEDITEGIAAFMAAYLLSLEQSKDLAPNKLQEALSKTFSTKKKKGKLQKAWDGTKVIYNVASWGATAIGVYQNPVLFSAASTAFWTSYGVISKLL